MIKELVERLKSAWKEAKYNPNENEPFFKIKCEFEGNKTGLPINAQVPGDLYEFWSIANAAKLFYDVAYGQWGVEIFSYEKSIQKTQELSSGRRHDFGQIDLIIGRFLGDSELLLINCDKNTPSYGSIKIVMPIDPKEQWPTIANSFSDFLINYSEANGDKYWE